MNKTWKRTGLALGLSAALVLAACGTDDDTANNDTNGDDGESSTAVAESLDYTITGIDAGAGVVAAAQDALDVYDLEGYEVQMSSSAAMTSALGTAIDNEEPIVVTGWNPHWKFAEYDLKYLEDPEGVFGAAEDIHTITRLGLADEMPEAVEVLGNFFWTEDDMGVIMNDINNGADPEAAAQEWFDNNQDKVAEWTDGVNHVDGDAISLAFVAWDSEIASTHLMELVLESVGYNVEISVLENSFMWEAVASGEADAMVAAWLPATHGSQWDLYQDQVDDLGPNLEGAKIGLVVPTYMDIDSIEDLNN
ncbi:glycine betaine ABC transporter substrate-binding protein [Alkalihalobacillus pseudalcaliphilus]|uniref:glycine betaine ABC transporter substrate-binding protein n=1 Tax=Alkalihalobacillus pseudalcaliphilus TaxID=79884 RepID=UPI00064D8C22|nr:glycine betaine ABC transporter substrate-binding protein [Alkalihalobacillus pseudalcaliphilus]KMK77764.1 glycine/betaine ABC transporter [Alkalihalobacillus pseudalcaliphilus]